MLANVKSVETLHKLTTEKSRKYLLKRVKQVALKEYEDHGWRTEKIYKNGDVQVKKPKPYGIDIRDRVWSILYKMKFMYMSGDESVQLHPNGKKPFQKIVEIDTVSVDSEVGVAIFLRTSPEERDTDEQFRQDLELYVNARSSFSSVINQIYKPIEQRHKIKTAFIIFTCNVRVSEMDRKFAKEKSIAIFDENDLEYYEELVEHLGAAAKYQFLADIFDDADIPSLAIAVPAIRLKVGKITYYSFSIQPEYLLKISYIAHRARGKKADLYAYQRMTEKSRLAEMREYIDRPAIFPTNIVINLKKKPIFEEVKLQNFNSQCGDLGVLKLRNAYKSAWVIDGQHRLYSYSGHSRSTSSLLSVLAFEDLPVNMQAEFFIDINSKQKRVQSSLFQELFDQVHRDAPDPEDRIKSLISQAIEQLNNDRESAFYERIQKAEDRKSMKRCISWNTVFNSISDSIFVGREHGMLYVKGNDNATKERIVCVVKQWFAAIKRDVPGWWDAGSGVDGGLAMNDSIAACFHVLKSVFQYLMREHNLVALGNQELAESFLPYAYIVSNHLASFTKNERQMFRDSGRGRQGQTQRARALLIAIHREIPEFLPPTLKEYMQEQERGKVQSLVSNMKQILLDLTITMLQNEFGEEEQQWWVEGIPYNTRQNILKRYDNDKGNKGNRNSYIDFDDYIVIIRANWDLFRDTFGYSSSLHYSDSLLAWIQRIKDIQDLINHDRTVTPEQLDELDKYHGWLRNRLSQR
jgi:DGQHR domain-containing protein